MSIFKGLLTRIIPVIVLTCYMVLVLNVYVIGNGGDNLLILQTQGSGLKDIENLVILPDGYSSKGEKITTPVTNVDRNSNGDSSHSEPYVEQKPKQVVSVTVSAAGDFTLGRDDKYPFEYSFDSEFEINGNDYSYFLRNVSDIFKADDFTFVSLEGVLTNATERAREDLSFRGSPEYVNILAEGSIEAVTIANDHINDYLQEGYEETVNTIIDAGLELCGEGFYSTYDAKGIKIGIMGLIALDDSQETKDKVHTAIQSLKDEGAMLIIAYFHWGVDMSYSVTEEQTAIARYAIDSGVDLVLGSHPRVLQPIEVYNGKRIVYSLGVFCYGGSRNPVDKDSMIYQQTFTFEDGIMLNDDNIKIIPVSISSDDNRNNYQPTPVTGDEYIRIRNKIVNSSKPYFTHDSDENSLMRAFTGE